MNHKKFWYIACKSSDVSVAKPKFSQILDEWLVLFRDEHGRIACLQDRCVHRHAQLSKGQVIAGQIVCPYHGWHYNREGKVTKIPAEGPNCKHQSGRAGVAYPCVEKQGYVYICLESDPVHTEPFSIPYCDERSYARISLINYFDNNVVNCAENFIDIPHTVFVHPTIFRNARGEKFQATVTRSKGNVETTYKNERANFGMFSKFLNPSGREIKHIDRFFMPNITSVEYEFGPHRHFFITSQTVPISPTQSVVYTDLTYNYGIWNQLAKPIIYWQAQAIINQDKVILRNQMDSIKKYGTRFQHSTTDAIHMMVESISDRIAKGEDPRLLPDKTVSFEFWV